MADLRFIVLSSGVLFVVIYLGLLVMDAVIGGRLPSAPGSISLRSTEPLRVSSAHAVTIPIAFGGN